MTLHKIEAVASELNLLAEELQTLLGAPDVLDRANDLIWQTARRLTRKSTPRDGNAAILVFPEPKTSLPPHTGILSRGEMSAGLFAPHVES